MPGGSIDAIKVALGADLKQLRNDLQNAKRDLEKALPEKRTVHVSVNVTTPNHAVSELYQNIQNQFAAFQKGAGHQALRIAPRLMADPRMMVMFRREVDRNMAIAGRSGQGIHVPVRFNGDVKAFVASIGKIEVPVYGRWAGYAPGGTPPTTNDGGPAGGQGPSGSSPTRPKKPSPPSVDERVNARAEAVAQRTQAGPVVAPIPTGRPKPSQRAKGVTPVVARGGGVEERSSDRYEPAVETPRPTPGTTRATRGTRTAQQDIDEVDATVARQVGATPPTGQKRQGARRAKTQGATPPTPRKTTTYGPGRRTEDVGAYAPPDGGRVDIGNVRGGSVQPELEGEARHDASTQMNRARPTPARGWAPQPDEPTLSHFDIRQREAVRGQLEARAQRLRAEQSEARRQSPADQAARGLLSNFSELNPDLGAAYETIADPKFRGSLSDLQEVSSLGKEAFHSAFHGQTVKSIRRQIGVVRGTKKGDINEVDPVLLSVVSALDAQKAYVEGLANPFARNMGGDFRRRGTKGKVGKSEGKNAGKSTYGSTVDPANVTAIVERLRKGGRGNGQKSLLNEGFTDEEIGAARAYLPRKAPSESEPQHEAYASTRLDEESMQGGVKTRRFTHVGERPTALPPQGGQGLFRREPEPERPQPRDTDRPGIDPTSLIGGGGVDLSRYAERASGKRMEGSPFARWFAQRARTRSQNVIPFRRFAEGGILEFREGGLVPGRQLRSYIGQGVPMPRIGSIARVTAEDEYLKGLRAKQKRQAKPTYQQGGNSDRRWRALSDSQFEKDPFCAYCGKQTVRGGGGAPNSFQADHKLDAGRGGAIYDPDNIISSCKSCNSYKSGGKSARLLMPGQRVKSLPSGGESPAAQAQRAQDYDSERHYHDGYAEGGMWGWGKKKMRGYAEGGGFGKLPAGLQGSARRNFGALTAEYGIPVNLKSGHGQGVHATPARSVVIGRDSQPGEKGEWPYTFAHEYGHLIDDSIPFRQRNKFMRGALGRLGHAEEFADMFAQAHRSGEDPFSIKDFIKTSGRVRGGVLGRSLNRMGQDFSLRFARRAEGGYVKHGGLLDRLAQAGHEPSVTMVGERGPELLVSDKNTGQTEIIPTHKVPTWLARAQEGKGFGKALDHHAEGGMWRMRGPAGPRAATPMRMNSGTLGGGDVTRVFVVNWPSSIGQGQFAAAQGHPAQAEARSPGSTQGKARQSPPPSPEDQAGQAPPRNERTDPGTTTGAPLPGVGRVRSGGTVNPYDKVRAREISLANEDREGSRASRIQAVKAEGTEKLQLIPARALSVSGGQISQTLFGGRSDILARQRAANVAAARAQRAETQYTSLRQAGAETRYAIADITSGRRDKDFATSQDRDATLTDLRDKYSANLQARREAGAVATRRLEQAETKQAGVLTTGQQIRTQVAGLGGIIAGTTVFSATMAAFSTATAAAATVLDPLVQTMLGWPAAIDKVTSSIRDSIAASGGNVRAGVAAALAPSGVSAAYVDARGQNLAATGLARAASTAGGLAQDITRASKGAPRGLYEGTGGLFGTNALTELTGGQPGYLQQVVGRLQANAPRPLRRDYTQQTPEGGFLGLFPNEAESYRRIANSPLGSDNYKSSMAEYAKGYGPADLAKDQVAQEDTIKDLNQQLQSAADYANDLGGAFQYTTKATKEQTQAMLDSAKVVGPEAEARAKGLQKAGVTVLGPGGRALEVQSGEFGKFGDQAMRGAVIQSPELLLRATEPQRKARAFAMAAQADFTRNEDIPAQAALQTAAQPLARFGTTFGTAGADQKTLDNIAAYTRMSAAADASIAKTTVQGTTAQEKILNRIDYPSFAGGQAPRTTADLGLGGPKVSAGGPGPALTNFRGIVGEIGSLGSQIASLTEGINLRQVNLQAHEYAEQIRLSERSLADSQDLWAGINGATSKTLGGLQGQNVLLDRQNQLLGRRAQRLAFKSEDIGFKSSDLQIQQQNLGFQQSQRQINFSKAVAGFAAPGETPEEIAARVNEAKIEADLAQKQLDLQIQIAEQGREQLKIAKEQAGINREQFGNQTKQQDNSFAITREEAKRAVTDIRAQLDLLKESRSITIDAAGVDATIEHLRKAQGVLIEEAGNYLTYGQEVRSAVLSDIESLMAATGKGFGELVTEVTGAWAAAFKAAYSNFLLPVSNYLNQMGRSGTSGNSHGGSGAGAGVFAASGYSGSVSTPTQFVAGEAGTEHVLVIKSPKTGTLDMSAGMGGGTTINVGGISIVVQGGKEMDEEKLAVAVERRITRKLALISG